MVLALLVREACLTSQPSSRMAGIVASPVGNDPDICRCARGGCGGTRTNSPTVLMRSRSGFHGLLDDAPMGPHGAPGGPTQQHHSDPGAPGIERVNRKWATCFCFPEALQLSFC